LSLFEDIFRDKVGIRNIIQEGVRLTSKRDDISPGVPLRSPIHNARQPMRTENAGQKDKERKRQKQLTIFGRW
jgi:hypothetical protein